MMARICIFVLTLTCALGAVAQETATAPTLYERLGGMDGIERIVRRTIELHEANPPIAPYVKHIDQEWLVGSVTAFFAAGTGGPNHYAGTDMHAAHAHLDLTDAEFDLAVSDVLAALRAFEVDEASYAEVETILNSFRGAIVTAP